MPIRLSRNLGDDFLLVHLVRDPRAVAWSTMRSPLHAGTTRKGRPKTRRMKSRQSSASRSLLTAFGWTIANLGCEMFGWLHPDRYLRLRYEDFVCAPLPTVGHVLTRVSLELPAALKQSKASSKSSPALWQRHALQGAIANRPQGRCGVEDCDAEGLPRAGRRAHLAAPPALPLRLAPPELRLSLLDDGREPGALEHMSEHEACSDRRGDEQDFGFESHGRTRDGPPSLVRAVNV